MTSLTSTYRYYPPFLCHYFIERQNKTIYARNDSRGNPNNTDIHTPGNSHPRKPPIFIPSYPGFSHPPTPDIRTLVPRIFTLVPQIFTPLYPGSRIPNIHTLATPDIHTLATPDIHTLATPDIHTLVTPDIHTLATPDIHTLATPDIHTVTRHSRLSSSKYTVTL